MGRWQRMAVFAVCFLGCEDHYSSSAPPLTPDDLPPPSPSSRIEALFAHDAAPSLDDPSGGTSRALTITACAASPSACSAASDGGSLGAAGYRVVSLSGRGEVRSRTQAMADLYREIRDRTSLGEHLDALPHAPGDAGGPTPVQGIHSAAKNADPIAQCASQLLDVVDGVGEMTLEVARGSGARGCMVSLGGSVTDGGAPQCVLLAPERAKQKGQGGGRRGR
jgi:hypothetical protein